MIWAANQISFSLCATDHGLDTDPCCTEITCSPWIMIQAERKVIWMQMMPVHETTLCIFNTSTFRAPTGHCCGIAHRQPFTSKCTSEHASILWISDGEPVRRNGTPLCRRASMHHRAPCTGAWNAGAVWDHFWDIEVTFVDRYIAFMCRFDLGHQCAAQSFCVSGSCSRSTDLCVSERQYASQSFFV